MVVDFVEAIGNAIRKVFTSDGSGFMQPGRIWSRKILCCSGVPGTEFWPAPPAHSISCSSPSVLGKVNGKSSIREKGGREWERSGSSSALDADSVNHRKLQWLLRVYFLQRVACFLMPTIFLHFGV